MSKILQFVIINIILTTFKFSLLSKNFSFLAGVASKILVIENTFEETVINVIVDIGINFQGLAPI